MKKDGDYGFYIPNILTYKHIRFYKCYNTPAIPQQ